MSDDEDIPDLIPKESEEPEINIPVTIISGKSPSSLSYIFFGPLGKISNSG